MNPTDLIFDFETKPLPRSRVEHLAPPEVLIEDQPTEITNEWIAAKTQEVTKPGNRPATIEKNLKAAIAEQEALNAELSKGGSPKWDHYMRDACLDPTRSMLCAIGLKTAGGKKLIMIEDEDDERKALAMTVAAINASRRAIGFNIKRFDLPYAMRRMMQLDVARPDWMESNGRYFSGKFIDLMESWLCGISARESWPVEIATSRKGQDYLCKVFGLPTKPGDGAIFWTYTKNDKEAYLGHDLDTVELLAQRMGAMERASGDNAPTGGWKPQIDNLVNRVTNRLESKIEVLASEDDGLNSFDID